ncbi:MAG: DUF58 domain-containing protein [Candidatus Eremiobacteraeota bacterium]|nr:DUF58 domain-containing protein [Candidatus Eremiobacteraeota bacterium]
MPALWLPVWASPRLFWALAAVAGLFILAGALPAALFIAIGAAMLLAGLLLVDAAWGPQAEKILVERTSMEHFALRVPAALGYRVTNGGSRTIRIGIIESPVAQLAFDVDELSGHIAAQSSTVLNRPVTPRLRGRVGLLSVSVWFENRLGLLRRRRRISLAHEARIYPDLSAVARYGRLNSRNRLLEAGLRKMRLRGTGTEFESLREWAGGDPFRAIDWKATARRGKLMVAQQEIERSQNIMLVLDCGRLMTPRIGAQRKFDYAVTSALSVATIAGLASDKIGFVAFASDILFASAPRSSKVALAQASEYIYDLEPRFEEPDYARAFSYVRGHLHKRSLIILFTDMFDPVASATVLSQIATLAKRHLVLCVFMNDAAVDTALQTVPHTTLDVYRASVAATLADERRAARTALGKFGVRVIDAPAAKLNTALIDAYLDVKARALL